MTDYQKRIAAARRRRARMLRLVEQGKSFADIAREYGISRQRVRVLLNPHLS